MDLSNKHQAKGFDQPDPNTKAIVGELLDKVHGVVRKLETLPKTINDVTVEQNAETRTVIIDAVRQIVEQKSGQRENFTSTGLAEVSSSTVADYVLAHLKFVGMHDRHEEVAEAFGETYTWVHLGPKSGHSWSSFTTWLRGEDSLYWINGKAGSGKVDIDEDLFDNQRTRDELHVWGGKQADTVGFFFWNSGTFEQRSSTGLRSMLFEIL